MRALCTAGFNSVCVALQSVSHPSTVAVSMQLSATQNWFHLKFHLKAGVESVILGKRVMPVSSCRELVPRAG